MAGLISLAAAALFIVGPLLQVRQAVPVETLKQAGSSEPMRLGAIRQCLVVLQVAFAMILLAGGAIVGSSLRAAYATDIGFQAHNLLTVSSSSRPEAPDALAAERAAARIAALPGVASAAVAQSLPLAGPHRSIAIRTPTRNESSFDVKYNAVGPNFLRTLGIDLPAGREFTLADVQSSTHSVIVNQTLADDLWPQADPLGQTLLLDKAGDAVAYKVIGIARDSKYESVWEPRTPYVYLPASGSESTFVVRTTASPSSLAALIRAEFESLDPRAVVNIASGDDLLRSQLEPQRLSTALLGSFAALALLIASIGIGSVLSCFVQRRTREIGIRLAVGAEPSRLLRWIVTKALGLTFIGVAIGGSIAFAVAPSLAFLAKDVDPRGLLTFAAAALLLLAVSFAAAVGPALRAASIDPALALRRE